MRPSNSLYFWCRQKGLFHYGYLSLYTILCLTIILTVEIKPETREEPMVSKPDKLPVKNQPEKIQKNQPEKIQKNQPEKIQKNVPDKNQKNVIEKAPKQSVGSKQQPASAATSNVVKKAQEKKVK